MTGVEKTTKRELQAARSDLLDAFAEVESAIFRLEAKHDLKPNNASLGQKIARLRKLEPTGDRSPLPAVLDQLVELNAVRTEVVHRPMSAVALQGTTMALFIARADDETLPPVARVMSLDRFRQLTARLRVLSKAISELAT